jgi:hypothetical protein
MARPGGAAYPAGARSPATGVSMTDRPPPPPILPRDSHGTETRAVWPSPKLPRPVVLAPAEPPKPPTPPAPGEAP